MIRREHPQQVLSAKLGIAHALRGDPKSGDSLLLGFPGPSNSVWISALESRATSFSGSL